jgi:hypothetical protein
MVSISRRDMRKSKLDVAKKLAKAHFDVDSDVKHVYLLEPLNEKDEKDPIKLLEVVEGTLELGVEPIAFGADPARGIEYPSLIVEVSPGEYKNSRRLRDALKTRGWKLGPALAG